MAVVPGPGTINNLGAQEVTGLVSEEDSAPFVMFVYFYECRTSAIKNGWNAKSD